MIHYLTKDDPDKAQACFGLFNRATASQITLTTTKTVITEMASIETWNGQPDLSFLVHYQWEIQASESPECL